MGINRKQTSYIISHIFAKALSRDKLNPDYIHQSYGKASLCLDSIIWKKSYSKREWG